MTAVEIARSEIPIPRSVGEGGERDGNGQRKRERSERDRRAISLDLRDLPLSIL
ncbi:hypothetical protein TIFTF001_011370 [Ficus carica]|uniref:Uncharacterized protein n=1 Tax=Ficus carica TaxID=3494 RepID=A0AA87ZTS7_FICCA|nr:hypothetical protein TIFTF001_011370 [Ficus carica]